MISVGKAYVVFKPKEKINSKGERTVSFSIGNSSYNKATQSFDNKGFVNVCAKTNNYINDRDKVTIQKITGIDTSEYNGKQYITIFVELEELQSQQSYEPLPEGELPF